jgi:hypothetical protein
MRKPESGYPLPRVTRQRRNNRALKAEVIGDRAALIGERLRVLRDCPKATSRNEQVSRGVTSPALRTATAVPAIKTLEKMARALEMPLYQVRYDGDEPPQERDEKRWGAVARMHVS